MGSHAETGAIGEGAAVDRVAMGPCFAERLLDALRDPTYFLDSHGRVLYWNAAAAEFTGRSAEDVLGRDDSIARLGFTDVTGVPLRAEDVPGMRSIREGRAVDRIISLQCGDGLRVRVEARCSPVHNDDGSLVGVLVVLRDASSAAALETALRRARRAAECDPLTGLANRRALDRMLELRLRLQASEGRRFCLILADLDRFKSINDGWGHMVGDRVLAAFAELLRSQSRAEDLVARFGGEEFVVILPDASLEIATRVADRLRIATPEIAPHELAPRRLTASFGVVEADLGETASGLLRRADEALYRAKAGGRNRVEVDSSAAAAGPFPMLPGPSNLETLRLGLSKD